MDWITKLKDYGKTTKVNKKLLQEVMRKNYINQSLISQDHEMKMKLSIEIS